ncbi:MAG: tRNA lysidine(34) synthetase TilS [Lachnospiraceae bacterium]|nr:tRNA lysidine(34) synthetase TilS [Lachnospiraceae bacterium]
MIKKVFNYVKKYRMIEPEDVVIAGISGGADSVCLLFMLLEIRKKIPFILEVVHVNHGIREDAFKDAEFVRKLCDEKDIPFYLIEVNVKECARAQGISEEEAGRDIRYKSFEMALNGRSGKIAVAHNSNDRAETMLFHLFRGTGLAGASGIRPVNGKIIRPLLCLKRSEIESYLKEKQISFCQDSTNEQDIYTRNRIRHHILTYAEREVCQGAVSNMSRAADQFLEAEEYIERQTKAAMNNCVETEKDGTVLIRLPDYFREDKYIQGCILLSCVEKAAGRRKDITAAHIGSILSLFQSGGNKEIHLPYDLVVYKKYDLGMIQKREFCKKQALEEETVNVFQVAAPSVLSIPGIGRVEFTVVSREYSQNIPQKTYTKWFDYDKITSSVMFRTKRAGDYLTINDKMGHQSLQNYFVNEKIPREERGRIYLLAEGSHVIWLPGYRISEYYKVQDSTRNILQVCVLDNPK